MEGHKNMKRILHRCMEEMDATKRIAKVTSWKEGVETFLAKIDIQIMNYNGYYENAIRKKHLLKKHEIMMRYFEVTFGKFLDTYDYHHGNLRFSKSEYADCIWICWWQGLDRAPEVVKLCVDSIKKNAGKHRVIILTENTYKQYVELPAWVEKKKNKGMISKTNYSDLLRLSLLAKYGGMWLDATFLCTKPVLSKYFEEPLWSIKRPDYFHASVASGYFAGYSLCCNEENRYIFKTIRDFFLYYWQQNDRMIDYLLVDYMIVLAQRHDKRIAEAFQNIKTNNLQCDELHKVMNEPFHEEKWVSMKEETCLFKLSWKYQYLAEKKGERTFYGKLLDGRL